MALPELAKMHTSRLRLSVFIIGFMSSLLSNPVFGFSYTMELTQQELQQKVSAMMPIEKTKFFVTVTISDPELVLLKETDEISIFANVVARIPGDLKGTGRGTIQGKLQYDAEKGQFFLKQATISELIIDGVPAGYNDKIRTLAGSLLVSTLEAKPVYALKDDNLKHKLAKSVLESIEVADGTLRVTLSAF